MTLFVQRKNHSSLALLFILPLMMTNAVNAQVGGGVFAFPNGGQSQAQQNKDKFECHNWAVQQTGFNPLNQQSTSAPSYAYSSQGSYSSGAMDFGSGEVGQGGVVRDGARGAAAGAIFGAIGGNAGKGAAIGAASGALFGGMRRSNRRREQERWQQQQQEQALQQMRAIEEQKRQASNYYRNAFGSCMSAKDYRVQ